MNSNITDGETSSSLRLSKCVRQSVRENSAQRLFPTKDTTAEDFDILILGSFGDLCY